MDKERNSIPQKDPHLDIPAEANRDKHINFSEAEDDAPDTNRKEDELIKKRREQWQQGVKEGEKAREEDR